MMAEVPVEKVCFTSFEPHKRDHIHTAFHSKDMQDDHTQSHWWLEAILVLQQCWEHTMTCHLVSMPFRDRIY